LQIRQDQRFTGSHGQMIKFADCRKELFNRSFAGDIERVTLGAGRQLSDGLIDLGFAAGGYDDRCAPKISG
jgi:hypothetical protein